MTKFIVNIDIYLVNGETKFFHSKDFHIVVHKKHIEIIPKDYAPPYAIIFPFNNVLFYEITFLNED